MSRHAAARGRAPRSRARSPWEGWSSPPLTAYLGPGADPAVWNAAWTAAFPIDPPARTTVNCGFVLPGITIEVSAVAVATGAVP